MNIKIANLSDGDHFFAFDEKVSAIGLEDPFMDNFKANIRLSKSHSQIILKTEMELQAVFECDRCTADYDTTLKTSFQIVYLFSRENINDRSDDIVYINPDADIINIGKELRDFALLSIPMKKLCSDECKGLCFRCGKDLNSGECTCAKENIDPRWEPLLKKKNINNN